MQILADRIEFCWIHLRGIGALENSLWGYDGHSIRVWLNALAIEAPSHLGNAEEDPEFVKESVNIPLDFYPMCKLSHLITYNKLTSRIFKPFSWTKASSLVSRTRQHRE